MHKMKDSGVAWLNEIPAHWEVVPAKALFHLRKEKANPGDRQLTASQQYGVIYQDDYMALTGNRVVTVEKDFSILKRVEKGDFVISMRSFQGGLEYSENSGSISSAYVMLMPNLEYVVPEFYKWVLKSPTYITALQCTSDLIRDGQAMRYANFVQVPLCIIPLEEQKKIADVLGKECKKIDALIANVQEQIEKLKAYKQSLITEVVTKGLDPNAPMKDSGVEWIGKIPEYWCINKIIRCFEVIGSGTTPKSTDDSLFDGNINWIQSGDINGGTLLKTRFQISEDVVNNISTLKIYQAPFIVIAMYGASIGNLSISQIAACTNQACCVLSNPVKGLLLEYLFYAFKPAKDYLIWKADGGGQPNISQDKVKSLWIPIPPIEEQERIVQYLDEKCAQTDRLIAVKQTKIEKLEQYKRSLIYEYVTGKKEVS